MFNIIILFVIFLFPFISSKKDLNSFLPNANTYTLSFEFTQAESAAITQMGGLCLMKGTQTTPSLIPVWYSMEYVPETIAISWQMQYGVFFSTTQYSAGLTISFGTSEAVQLGTCVLIDDTNQWSPCDDSVPPNAELLESTRSSDPLNYVTAGMYQTILSSTERGFSSGINAFYAAPIYDFTGKLLIVPLQTITVGACSYTENTLAIASELTGAYTFDFTNSFSLSGSFSLTNNSFYSTGGMQKKDIFDKLINKINNYVIL